MKKRLYILLLFVITFICVLPAFASGSEDETVVNASNDAIPVGEKYCREDHDDNGNLVKSVWYRDSSIIQWYEWEYDEHDNMVKQSRYYPDGSIELWAAHEYDANGNNIKIIAYNPDDSIIDWRDYEYYDNGNRAKETEYNADGSIRYEMLYNNNGNPVKEINYNADGSIIDGYEYEYDENGNRIRNPLTFSEAIQQTAPQTGDSLFSILLILLISIIFSIILYKRKCS